jgi:hypothetical protein
MVLALVVNDMVKLNNPTVITIVTNLPFIKERLLRMTPGTKMTKVINQVINAVALSFNHGLKMKTFFLHRK